jgi:predicted Rossmann-fold nucleotide-binding protein
MSDDFTTPEEQGIEEDAEQVCRLIRRESISPLTWFFPASNACVSCILLTGGRPGIMAAYCPRVLERLAELVEQNEQNEPEGEPES